VRTELQTFIALVSCLIMLYKLCVSFNFTSEMGKNILNIKGTVRKWSRSVSKYWVRLI
jgi:hypothetical protein